MGEEGEILKFVRMSRFLFWRTGSNRSVFRQALASQITCAQRSTFSCAISDPCSSPFSRWEAKLFPRSTAHVEDQSNIFIHALSITCGVKPPPSSRHRSIPFVSFWSHCFPVSSTFFQVHGTRRHAISIHNKSIRCGSTHLSFPLGHHPFVAARREERKRRQVVHRKQKKRGESVAGFCVVPAAQHIHSLLTSHTPISAIVTRCYGHASRSQRDTINWHSKHHEDDDGRKIEKCSRVEYALPVIEAASVGCVYVNWWLELKGSSVREEQLWRALSFPSSLAVRFPRPWATGEESENDASPSADVLEPGLTGRQDEDSNCVTLRTCDNKREQRSWLLSHRHRLIRTLGGRSTDPSFFSVRGLCVGMEM